MRNSEQSQPGDRNTTMSSHSAFRIPHSAFGMTRREALHAGTFGVGTVALAWLLNLDRLLAEPAKPDLEKRRFDLTPKPPHFPAKATAMISLFMQGGPSHMDLLDPKPALDKLDGKPFPGT